MRIVASVLDLPLEHTDAEEGSAFGAALLAGVRDGVFANVEDAVSRCVRVSARVEPEERWVAVYEEGYARYRELYPALRPLERAVSLRRAFEDQAIRAPDSTSNRSMVPSWTRRWIRSPFLGAVVGSTRATTSLGAVTDRLR